MDCLLISNDNEKTIFDTLNSMVCLNNVFCAKGKDEVEESCLLNHPEIVVVDISDGDENEINNLVMSMLPNSNLITYTDYQSFSFETKLPNRERVTFLLRPCDISLLKDTIERISYRINNELSEEFSLNSLTGVVDDNIPVIRQHYLSMIMRKSLPKNENILHKFSELQINCPGPYYTVIVANIELGESDEQHEAISFLLRTHIKEEMILQGLQCYVFFDSDFNINCLIGSESPSVSSTIENVLSSIKKHFEQTGDVFLGVGIGRTVSSAQEIHNSFDDAQIANLYSQNSTGSILLYNNISATRKREYKYDKMIDNVTLLLLNGDYEKFKEKVKYAFDEIVRLEDLSIVKKYSIKLFLSTLEALDKIGIDILSFPKFPQILTRTYSSDGYKDLLNNIDELISTISFAEDEEQVLKRELVNDALSYIDYNLSNPNLSLDSVSDYVKLSKSYFCALFKNVMNQGFSDYVRCQRIDLAKQLLRNSNKKIYEIANETGFVSSKYFSSVFRMETGMTPKEFQKSINNYEKG